MKTKLDSDQVIEQMITAMLGQDAGVREQHVCRESLRNLVRLAKTEQVMEIKQNVRKLTGALEQLHARRRVKAVLLAQRLPGLLDGAQRRLEFN
jgi:hypothetical protein